jgi:hypothetical protein
MTAQMTEWYPPETKPVRVGVYKTWYGLIKKDAFWDGAVWRLGHADGYELAYQDRCWRGLAADPKGSKS